MREDHPSEAARPGDGGGVPRVRVFVSSPGDVAEERAVALTVLRRLQGYFQGRLVLVPILWEHQALLATAGFQEEIDRRAPPASCDVALFVLWSRLGTPLGPAFALEDGSRPTGTEWEFENAIRGSRGRGVPHLLVYRKHDPPDVKVTDPRFEERRADWSTVEAFFRRHFRDAADLSFTGSYHRFEDAAHFGRLLEEHLAQVLSERLGQATAEATWRGTPFRGLETFEAEHAPVFFGRARAIQEVRQALARQVRVGRAFVLILGRSGNGKSSLARAGVLPLLGGPWLVEEGVEEGFCRRAVMHPAAGGSPLEALAEALLAEDALPDLGAKGGATELAALFAESPRNCVGDVKAALGRIAAPPPGRLLLLVDQLEELFTAEGVSEADRQDFARVLDALARSGAVYVLATLRSDFYLAFSRLQPLMTLKEGAGHYDLAPVDAAETAQIVRGPAQVAGLAYQVDARRGASLDEVLIAEATKGPDALPLLEYALTQLEERKEDHTLTFQAYEAMGGLEGAIAKRAEAEWAALPEAAREAFPTVLRALVEVGEAGEASTTRRRAPLEEVSRTPGARAFVERFVRARLLVAHGDGEKAVVSVAHEALLRTWRRVAERLETEAELLRVRSRMRRQAARWVRQGRERSLLLPQGKLLEEARLLRAAAFELTETESAFLEASEARATRLQRLRRTAMATIGVLAVVALLLALFAMGKQREAEEALDDVYRLSDAKKVRDLLDEAERLWPIHPDRAPAMQDWLKRAEGVFDAPKRAGHEERLAGLEALPTAEADEVVWMRQVLEDLLARMDWLQKLASDIRERHEKASTLHRRSLVEHEDRWVETIQAIGRSEPYRGLQIVPQLGLVPLGPDPDSGLFEFAHLGSGTVPSRDPVTSELRFDDETAIVLVLIPGGTFHMGAQSQDPEGRHHDDWAESDEAPVREVTLPPFFLAKHECTQAQWLALTGEPSPSFYKSGEPVRERDVTLRNPVEGISWEDCDRWVRRWNLALPTEAQWEYACRAGQATPWHTGRDPASLQGYANIADAYGKANGGVRAWIYSEGVNDGHFVHAPVGSYQPNAFGLHDVHGNLWEWCRDIYGTYAEDGGPDPVEEGGAGDRVTRGGSWYYPAPFARSANRGWRDPAFRDDDLGVRPARPLTTD